MSYLHVLNGNTTLSLFRQSEVPGDVIVCREMMCEEKVKYTNDLAVFFESRAKQLSRHYGIDKQTYYTNIVQELEKLSNPGVYEEVILWFEYNLYCQVNLLFILDYIVKLHKDLPHISIVDLPQHSSVKDFQPLFERRIRLQPHDLQMAAYTWEAYCLDTPLILETISKLPASQLIHLPAAITAHLKRFPNVDNGLNIIEEYFLTRLLLGDYRWYNLYMLFWDDMEIYGFSNFQLDIIINRMRYAGVLEEEREQVVKITSLGREIMEREENYLDYVSLEHRWLGGVKLSQSPWRWDSATNSLVEVT